MIIPLGETSKMKRPWVKETITQAEISLSKENRDLKRVLTTWSSVPSQCEVLSLTPALLSLWLGLQLTFPKTVFFHTQNRDRIKKKFISFQITFLLFSHSSFRYESYFALEKKNTISFFFWAITNLSCPPVFYTSVLTNLRYLRYCRAWRGSLYWSPGLWYFCWKKPFLPAWRWMYIIDFARGISGTGPCTAGKAVLD